MDEAVFSRQTAPVDDQTVLRVGSIEMILSDVGYELLAAFRDDMLQAKHVRIRNYWSHFGPPSEDDPVLTIQEYRVTGHILAERLDLMGFDEVTTLAMVAGSLAATRALGTLGIVEADEYRVVGSLTAASWVERLRESTDYLPGISGPDLRSRSWLLSLIDGLTFMRRLRTILIAFPEVDVVLDHLKADRQRNEELPAWNAHDATEALRHQARAHSPVVVLTEGRTDAEFLEAAMTILYPHLTDLIRFLDYERRPEGGAGALANTIRSFFAAGITNRIVAIFDNDTAAADALRNLDPKLYEPHIQVLHYPNLELAENYPTLGPPTCHSPGGSPILANINGLAGSIEIYLGRDILTQNDGTLQPVQWTSFSHGMRQYQGEIIDKPGLHKRFREKYKHAIDNPAATRDADWSGLRLILDAIRKAAQRAQYPADQ